MERALNKVGITMNGDSVNISQSLIDATFKTYTLKCRELLESNLSCAQFLDEVDAILSRENEYIISQIDFKLGQKLKETAMNALLTNSLPKLLVKAFVRGICICYVCGIVLNCICCFCLCCVVFCNSIERRNTRM